MLVNDYTSGGWLARAALGDGSWNVEGDGDAKEARAADRVRALITVGAIHKPPAGDAASACVTRGALSYLDKKWPGAYHKDEGIAYVSVAGDAILGKYTYAAVSGNRDVTGDGVVPLDWALLEGSRKIILDDVTHTTHEAGTTSLSNKWYGANEVLDRWLFDALEEAGVNVNSDNGSVFTLKNIESFLPRL